MGTSRFTNAERREIEKIYRVGGFSTNEIGKQYRASGTTIVNAIRRVDGRIRTSGETHRLLHKAGRKWSHRHFTDTECKQIEKIYCVGLFSTPEIARGYRVSANPIIDAIRRAGGRMRRAGETMHLAAGRGKRHVNRSFTVAEGGEIEKIYRVGVFPVDRIARQYGCGYTAINNAIKSAGGAKRTVWESRRMNHLNLVRVHTGGYAIITVSRPRGNAYRMARQVVAKSEWVAVHRLVMALHLRRPLLPSEIVHHRDGNKINYHISNLELLTQETHTSGWGDPYYQKWQEALTENKELRAKLSQLRKKVGR